MRTTLRTLLKKAAGCGATLLVAAFTLALLLGPLYFRSAAQQEANNEMLLNALVDHPGNRAFLGSVAARDSNLCRFKQSPRQCSESLRQAMTRSPARWPRPPAYMWTAIPTLGKNPAQAFYMASYQWDGERTAKTGRVMAQSEPFPGGGVIWSLSLELPHIHGSQTYCPGAATPQGVTLYVGAHKYVLSQGRVPAACLVVRAERAKRHWHKDDRVQMHTDLLFVAHDSEDKDSDVDRLAYSRSPQSYMQALSLSFTAAEPRRSIALSWEQLVKIWPPEHSYRNGPSDGAEADTYAMSLLVFNVTTVWHEDSHHEEAEYGRAVSGQLVMYRVLEMLQLQHQWCEDCDKHPINNTLTSMEEGNPIELAVLGEDDPDDEYVDPDCVGDEEVAVKPGPLRSIYSWRAVFRTQHPAELLTVVLIASCMECHDMTLISAVHWLDELLYNLKEEASEFLSEHGSDFTASCGALPCSQPPLIYFAPCRSRYRTRAQVPLTLEGLPSGLTLSHLHELARPEGVGGRLWLLLQVFVWHSGAVPPPSPSGTCRSRHGSMDSNVSSLESSFKAFLRGVLESGAGAIDDASMLQTGGYEQAQAQEQEYDWAKLLRPLEQGFSSVRDTGSSEGGCRLLPWAGGQQRRMELHQAVQNAADAGLMVVLVACCLLLYVCSGALWRLVLACRQRLPFLAGRNVTVQSETEAIDRRRPRNASRTPQQRQPDTRRPAAADTPPATQPSDAAAEHAEGLGGFWPFDWGLSIRSCTMWLSNTFQGLWRAMLKTVSLLGRGLTTPVVALCQAGIAGAVWIGYCLTQWQNRVNREAASGDDAAALASGTPQGHRAPTGAVTGVAAAAGDTASGNRVPRGNRNNSNSNGSKRPARKDAARGRTTVRARPEPTTATASPAAAAVAAATPPDAGAPISNAIPAPDAAAAIASANPATVPSAPAADTAAAAEGQRGGGGRRGRGSARAPARGGPSGAAESTQQAARGDASATASGPGAASTHPRPPAVATRPTPPPADIGSSLLRAGFDVSAASHAAAAPEEVMCLVCLDAPREMGFLHGGVVHTGVCGLCAGLLRSRGPDMECIVCRQPVECLVAVFS